MQNTLRNENLKNREGEKQTDRDKNIKTRKQNEQTVTENQHVSTYHNSKPQ